MKAISDYTADELFALARDKKKEEDLKFVTNKFFRCRHCEKSSRPDKWSQVFNHWFEDSPYTPNWHWDKEIRIICPKCRWLNRMYDTMRWQEEPIKHKIKAEIEEYIRRDGKFAICYNTYTDCGFTSIYEYNECDGKKEIYEKIFLGTVNVEDSMKK